MPTVEDAFFDLKRKSREGTLVNQPQSSACSSLFISKTQKGRVVSDFIDSRYALIVGGEKSDIYGASPERKALFPK